jgi:putative tryptophan/tyrosine transport system substrate-binding protein
MRRREFIAGLGGAVAWPLRARAQRPAIPTVGLLSFASNPNEAAPRFRQALSEAGYIEGRDVRIEVRSADGQSARLPELAANLVHSQVAVIVARDGAAIDAAKAATPTIPIVFNTNLDPVKFGLVASLNEPGGNLTGMTLMTSEIVGKQLQLLHEMVPEVTTFGFLSDPLTRTAEDLTNSLVAASRVLGAELVVAEARSRSDIDTAFATLVQRGTGALVVGPYLRFDTNRVLELAARNKIPAMYRSPEWVRRGGLMSYGANLAGLSKATVNYVVRILKGAKPANLPVQQPTAFDLTINLTTAKRLGLAVPQTLFVVATELID